MNIFKLIEDNGLQLHGDIEHFAHLVAEAEREECAKVCEAMADKRFRQAALRIRTREVRND